MERSSLSANNMIGGCFERLRRYKMVNDSLLEKGIMKKWVNVSKLL